MADIFGNTQVPAWLQRIAQPIDSNITGQVFGELIGGVTNAFQSASDKQKQGVQTSWIKELPKSIQAARINMADPLGALKVQQAQLALAGQKLQMDAQQSLIDTRKQKLSLMEHDQNVLPKWLQEHPTWESRQDAEPPQLFTSEGQRMFRDVQLGDAGNIKHKAIVEGINAYSKSVAELQKLDPIAAAPFAAQIGKVPTPDMSAELGDALAAAKAKGTADIVPKEKDGIVYNPKSGAFKIRETPEQKAEAEVAKKGAEAKIDVVKSRIKELEKALIKNPEEMGLGTQLRQARHELKALTEPKTKKPDQAAPKPKLTYDPATDTLK